MKMSWKSFGSLRISIIVVLLLVWNGAVIGSVIFNDTIQGSILISMAALSISAFFGAVVFLEKVRKIAIAPSRSNWYSSGEFRLGAVILGALGVIILTS